jgi:hypothetical protein
MTGAIVDLTERDAVARRIYLIRGRRVMLDADLATLYGVPTKALNLAVKRNAIRFPQDFMFRLSPDEAVNLRFQSETSSWGGRRYLPRAFTEQGVAMLSSVLRGKRAALVNIAIMRAFAKLRSMLAIHKELSKKFAALERRVAGHDENIRALFETIRELMDLPEKPRTVIGFKPRGE